MLTTYTPEKNADEIPMSFAIFIANLIIISDLHIMDLNQITKIRNFVDWSKKEKWKIDFSVTILLHLQNSVSFSKDVIVKNEVNQIEQFSFLIKFIKQFECLNYETCTCLESYVRIREFEYNVME